MNELNGKYVIIRGEGVGSFAGILKSFDPATRTAVLAEARRLWQWQGAMTLSSLAVSGTSKPRECKFPIAVPIVIVTSVYEIYLCTEAGRRSIEGVPVWEK